MVDGTRGLLHFVLYSIIIKGQQALWRCGWPLSCAASLFKPAVHGCVFQRVFTAGRLPYQRGHTLSQTIKGALAVHRVLPSESPGGASRAQTAPMEKLRELYAVRDPCIAKPRTS